ncbi:MAG: carboxymuconolactone decarboxylase family protein [Planctomycetes bacterium]|nr:carboxymuconolactone decarboxylase family protein [Planctomycetota bacterium]
MQALETLRADVADFGKDLRLNLQAVLDGASVLDQKQRWGIAVAVAATLRERELTRAVVADARAAVGENVVDDALAAAAVMGMNNVFYRFRHLVGKDGYASKPARLRMNRVAQVKGSKLDFELFSLAASALGACAACVQAHERAVLEGGLSDDHVQDAVRIAAVLRGFAIAYDATADSRIDSNPAVEKA